MQGAATGPAAESTDRRLDAPRRPARQDSPLLQEIRERQRLLETGRDSQRAEREQKQRQIAERLAAADQGRHDQRPDPRQDARREQRPDPRPAVFKSPPPAPQPPVTARSVQPEVVDLYGITATLRDEIATTISREIQSLRDHCNLARPEAPILISRRTFVMKCPAWASALTA